MLTKNGTIFLTDDELGYIIDTLVKRRNLLNKKVVELEEANVIAEHVAAAGRAHNLAYKLRMLRKNPPNSL